MEGFGLLDAVQNWFLILIQDPLKPIKDLVLNIFISCYIVIWVAIKVAWIIIFETDFGLIVSTNFLIIFTMSRIVNHFNI